jgi:hypothetical protein
MNETKWNNPRVMDNVCSNKRGDSFSYNASKTLWLLNLVVEKKFDKNMKSCGNEQMAQMVD